ncbi:MAG: hypothetical protein AAGG68_06450 [Bacteroidota bacterium]
MYTRTVFLFLLSLCCLTIQAQDMTNKKLQRILEETTEKVDGKTGLWRVTHRERILMVITDESANRVRIFTFVTEEAKLEAKHIKRMLNANFHSALDAKYALSNGFVISVFTHPLKELTEAQTIDALKQVVTLSHTFGTTYTSTDWAFGGVEEEGLKPRNVRRKKTEKRL